MKEAIADGPPERRGTRRIPRDRLREIARLHLDRLGRDRVAGRGRSDRAAVRRRSSWSSSPRRTLREYLGIIRDVDRRGSGERGLPAASINPTLAAKLVFGALDEMATNWILSRRKYSLVDEADAIVDLLVGGLAAAEVRP